MFLVVFSEDSGVELFGEGDGGSSDAFLVGAPLLEVDSTVFVGKA